MSHCSHCHNEHPGHTHSGRGLGYIIRFYRAEIVSGLMLIAGAIMSHFHLFGGGIAGIDLFEFAWYIISVLPVGVPIIAEAWSEWKRFDFLNEFTLMLLAAAGAFFIKEFPEGVAILLFYSFGEKMEHSASGDVRERIRNLIGGLPDKAFVVDEDGNLSQVLPQEVASGTIIVVRAGERVPIDGVIQGDVSVGFDTSAITGEAVPRIYTPGDEVLSGMIPIDRSVTIKTARAFSDSSMSRMMRLVEEAASKKSRTESMLRRITRWYTPLVICLALLLFFVPWIISLLTDAATFDADMWLRRSLVFLVCSCPCALVVSVPLSYFASMGSAARMGLLFKDSAHIDSMRKIDTVMFDKTGTLTTGSFFVREVGSASAGEEDYVLSLCAAVDSGSAHPLARAIEEKAREKSLVLPEVRDVVTVAHGVRALTGSREVILVGSRRLMKENNVILPCVAQSYTEVCVAVNGVYAGSIFLEDTLKSEAREVIERIRKKGVRRVEILSGDMEEAVGRIAREVGADGWHSQLLPEDKQRIIRSFQSKGNVVAFVGDGINDAPALMAADVGVAMGAHGTDMAMESADLVVAGDDLSVLPEAIVLSRRVRRVVMENIIFAFGVKILVMLLGALGIATLWAAVFADTGVTAVTIIWTLVCLIKMGKSR